MLRVDGIKFASQSCQEICVGSKLVEARCGRHLGGSGLDYFWWCHSREARGSKGDDERCVVVAWPQTPLDCADGHDGALVVYCLSGNEDAVWPRVSFVRVLCRGWRIVFGQHFVDCVENPCWIM